MEKRSFQKDNLTVHIFPTRSEMGRQAAADIAAALRKLLAEKEEVNVMFAAAPSQSDVHSALISEEGIDWKRVNAFHMDEYVGLDASHPAGFRNFLKRALFDILPFKSINLIKTPSAGFYKIGNSITCISTKIQIAFFVSKI